MVANPSFRRHIALLGAIVVFGLSGCAALSGPSDSDRAAWRSWFDQAMDAAAGTGTGAPIGGSASAPEVEITPGQTYRAVELRCIGTDRATFTLTYTTSSGDATLSQEIVCHGGGRLTPIAIPTASQELTRFAASATSPDGEGYWVAALQK